MMQEGTLQLSEEKNDNKYHPSTNQQLTLLTVKHIGGIVVQLLWQL